MVGANITDGGKGMQHILQHFNGRHFEAVHDFFFDGKKQLSYQFRRQLNNEYILTVMEFFAGNRCDVQNPWIVVLIREIS